MGVLGLVPFLRKKSPHVLKSVPSRFKELQGKVVVFDGTLITQRFHFAPTPHDYRHILGWYRMIKELHENNVRAICVFDGKERHVAKQREAMRRREQRRMTCTRGAMEMKRLSRLIQLTPLVTSYESLSQGQKVEVAASLQNVIKDFPQDQYQADKMTLELEKDRTNAQLDHSGGSTETPSAPNAPPLSATRDEFVDSALEEVTLDLTSPNIATEPANSEPSSTQTTPDQAEESSKTSLSDSSTKGNNLNVGTTLQPQITPYALVNPVAESPAREAEASQPSPIVAPSPLGAITDLRPQEPLAPVPIVPSESPAPRLPKPELQVAESPPNPVDSPQTGESTPPVVEQPSGKFSDYIESQPSVAEIPVKIPREVREEPSSIQPQAESGLESIDKGFGIHAVRMEEPEPEPVTVPTLEPTPVVIQVPEQQIPPRPQEPLAPVPTDPSEPPAPRRVSSMLAALCSSFLASVLQMGVLLSPRTILPRPEEQDDETKVTQELSQAQRRLVTEEEQIWKRLSEVTSEGETRDVSFLARELEDKSAKIVTSYERRNNPLTSEVYDQSRIILRAMGVPCIDAKDGVEGEALAAAIVRDGIADYVASEDTDVLVYDAPLLRNVTSGTEPLTLIEGHEVRDALDLDPSQFLDFTLLLGTDFTDRIRNVGPMRAYKFILSHGSIEKIVEGEPKYTPKTTVSDYLEQIRAARAVFQLRPKVPTQKLLEVRKPNDDLVLEVLQRFRLQRFAEKDADFSSLLGDNYFSDHP